MAEILEWAERHKFNVKWKRQPVLTREKEQKLGYHRVKKKKRRKKKVGHTGMNTRVYIHNRF